VKERGRESGFRTTVLGIKQTRKELSLPIRKVRIITLARHPCGKTEAEKAFVV